MSEVITVLFKSHIEGSYKARCDSKLCILMQKNAPGLLSAIWTKECVAVSIGNWPSTDPLLSKVTR